MSPVTTWRDVRATPLSTGGQTYRSLPNRSEAGVKETHGMTANGSASRPDMAPNESDAETAPPSVWDDPSVPVGNAPPRSMWSLVLLGTAWAGWVVFLVFMVRAAQQASGC